jgi:hypothetical protein
MRRFFRRSRIGSQLGNEKYKQLTSMLYAPSTRLNGDYSIRILPGLPSIEHGAASAPW